MRTSEPVFVLPREHTLARRYITLTRRRSPTIRQGRSFQRHLLFSARNAIFWALKALNILPGSRILVPSYICRAAIEPIVAYGAKVDFYAVTRNCQIDVSDLEARIQDHTKAILAVHYFGFPQPLDLIKALCDRFGLFLIEDCAHVLQADLGERCLGTFGDASVFSWRKFLPMYDGGELVIKHAPVALDIESSKEPFLLTLKIAKTLLENSYYSTEQLTANLLPMWMRAGQRIWNHFKKDGTYQNHPISFDKRAVSLRMSRISRYIMAHSDLAGVSSSRRANYGYLSQELGLIEGISVLFPNLPRDVCPWVLPFFVDGVPDAHFNLHRFGIPAVTWDGVRPNGVSGAAFPNADFLYRNLVFLPVHQCLQESDLKTMVTSVKGIR